MITQTQPIDPPQHAGTRVPFFVPLFNPIARRLLRVGLPLGPNALLTVTGRKTGQPRSTPVAVVDLGGRRWVIGTFGEVNWVRNLRAAGQATRIAGPVNAFAQLGGDGTDRRASPGLQIRWSPALSAGWRFVTS